jgi:predicted dehydrogenase
LLKGAVIGCGPAGRTHLAAWRRVRTARIECVLDLDPAQAQRAARDFGVGRHYAAFDRMQSEARLDFVDLACGVEAQPTLAARALESGWHVLAETPLAGSLEKAGEIVDLAEAKRRRLMVAYTERWRSAFRELKRALDSGAAAPAHYVRFFDRRPLSRARPVDPSRPALEHARHLLVLEGLTGCFDLVRWLFGEIGSVWGATGHFNPAVKGEDFALAALRAGDVPTSVILDINWSGPLSDRQVRPAPLAAVRIEGASGAIEFDPQANVLLRRGHAGGPVEQKLPPVPDLRLEPYVEMLGHFAECLESGKPMENEGREALAPLAAALAVYESARTGGMVLLKKP